MPKGTPSIFKYFRPAREGAKKRTVLEEEDVDNELLEIEEDNRVMNVGEYTQEELEMFGNGEVHELLTLEDEKRDVDENISDAEAIRETAGKKRKLVMTVGSLTVEKEF